MNHPRADLDFSHSRRKILGLFGKAGGLGPFILAQHFSTPPFNESSKLASAIGRAVGPKRLDSEPAEILNEFAVARPGVLIPYFQLFWPVHRIEGKLIELEILAKRALQERQYTGDEYRLIALPSLAHVHAIGSPRPDERSTHEAYVLQTIQVAISQLDQTNTIDSAIGVLEFVWRTMIAALIRNEDSWNTFHIGAKLLDQANIVVELFLSGDRMLFSPAILAWQFLLTYERAVRSQGTHEHNSVHKRIAQVEKLSKSPHFWWFERLRELFSRRFSFEAMLPQASETFMGHRLRRYDRRVNDFFLAVHLERVFVNFLLHKDLNSSRVLYHRTAEIEGASLRVLAAFGVTPDDWMRVRMLARNNDIQLSRAAITYWDKKFASYQLAFSNGAHAAAERVHVRDLVQWLEFRERDEEAISKRRWGSIEKAVAAFALAGLRGVWLNTILFEAKVFAKANKVSLHRNIKNVIMDEASEFIDKKVPVYSEMAGNLLEELKLPPKRVAVWTRKLVSFAKGRAPLHSRRPGVQAIAPISKELLSSSDEELKYTTFSSMFPEWRVATSPEQTEEDKKFHARLRKAAEQWRENHRCLGPRVET